MTVAANSKPRAAGGGKTSLATKEARLGWALVSPTFLIVIGLVVFPAIFSIWVSFHDIGLKNLNDVFHAPFVGLENYRRVFDDFAFKYQGAQSWGAAVTSIVFSFTFWHSIFKSWKISIYFWLYFFSSFRKSTFHVRQFIIAKLKFVHIVLYLVLLYSSL